MPPRESQPSHPLPPRPYLRMPCPQCGEGQLAGEGLSFPPTGGDYEWVSGTIRLRCTECRALFSGSGQVWLSNPDA